MILSHNKKHGKMESVIFQDMLKLWASIFVLFIPAKYRILDYILKKLFLIRSKRIYTVDKFSLTSEFMFFLY